MNELNIAFKEWAVVVNALLSGKQTIIFRKGGIVEEKGSFSVDHENFLLFPTYAHQKKEDLVSSEWDHLAQASAEAPNEKEVRIPGYIKVSDVHFLDTLAKVKQFENFGIWSHACLKHRFEWGKHKGIHMIIGRVFHLSEPAVLPMEKDYSGCKSWVELKKNVSLEGSFPALTDDVFEEQRLKINSLFAEDAPIDY